MNIGKLSENVLKHSVLHQIHTVNEEILNGADIGEDCAIFAVSGADTLATCMREGAVALEEEIRDGGQSAGEEVRTTIAHLIQKCANNLAVSGALPMAAELTLLLPENVEPDWIKALMREAAEVCRSLSLPIAGGQSRVTGTVSVPWAVVTGYGRGGQNRPCTAGRVRPGQEIVLSKWVGLEGTAILARRHRERLLARYPARLAEEAAGFDRYLSILPEAALAMKSNVCAMHDASEGGIFAALWELADRAGVGLTIDLKKIPLRQETVEVCESCGANPYELLSGGCLIMAAEDGACLAETLEENGIPAAVIGRTTDGSDRVIRNDGEIRYLERPGQDEIYKQCLRR